MIRSCAIALVALYCAQALSATAPEQVCIADPVKAAAEVLSEIRARDGEGLAVLVHADRGVRMSPSAYIDTDSDVVLCREEVRRIWSDERPRAWGYAEATGDPIHLRGADYLSDFVALEAFDTAAPVIVEASVQSGGTVNNAAEVYPGAVIVEYRDEGADDTATDWSALRLVFEQDEQCQRLIGVISDRWAP